MHLLLGNMVSAGGSALRLYKWRQRRRQRALRASQRRQFLCDGIITLILITVALIGMVLLARAG